RLVFDWITNEKIPLTPDEQRAYDKCVAELEKRDWRLDDLREMEKVADVLYLEEVPRMAYAPQMRCRLENCHYYSFLSDDKLMDRVNRLFGEYLMKMNAEHIAGGNFWHRTSGLKKEGAKTRSFPSVVNGAVAGRTETAAPTEKTSSASFLPGYLLEEKHKDRMAKLLFSTSYLEYCSYDNKLKLPLVALQRRQNIDQYIS